MENSEAIEVAGVLDATALEGLTRGEADIQIATAHRFPRSMTKFIDNAIEIATIDEDVAESCIYSRPVGKQTDPKTGKRVMKFADGMSVRMAEIIGSTYGNLRAGSFLVEMTERYVKARGMAHDLESNFSGFSEVVESTIKSDGNPMSERMRVVIAKAALSKARRDAIFQVVPRALCKPVERAVRAIIAGDGSASTISKRREKVMTWVNKLGIDFDRVLKVLGVKGEPDIGIDELERLSGLKTAIKEDEITVDEAFPFIPQPETEGTHKIGEETKSETVDKNTGEVQTKSEPMMTDDHGRKIRNTARDLDISVKDTNEILFKLTGKRILRNIPDSRFKEITDILKATSMDNKEAEGQTAESPKAPAAEPVEKTESEKKPAEPAATAEEQKTKDDLFDDESEKDEQINNFIIHFEKRIEECTSLENLDAINTDYHDDKVQYKIPSDEDRAVIRKIGMKRAKLTINK